MRFSGKVAVITGGGRGIGEVYARALAKEGAAIVVAEVDMAAAEQVASTIKAAGGRAIAARCDVANEGSVNAMVAEAVNAYGGVDILVNNAAKHLMEYNQPCTKLPVEKWRLMLDVNVTGIVICSKACQASMKSRGGGVIVNQSSIASEQLDTAYAISKLAVRGLTVALAKEFAPDGTRVNCIAPGMIGSPSLKADLPKDMLNDILHKKQLLPILAEPEDLVGALLFLCSTESRFMTGETMVLSGGWLAQP